MSYQYPNLAQSNGSPPPPPEDATLTAIHNAFLLGWSLMELKSRVQIAACNVALDSILIIQPQSADPPGCIGYLDHPFKKKSFGLPSSASFSLSGELSHRSRRGIVLVYKRKHGDMGSRPSRKACSGCMRELQKASSDTTLLAGWSSSTRLPLAHVVLLQATQR